MIPTVSDISDVSALHAMVVATRPRSAWPTIAKCQALASLVLANRPAVVVEIGVWTGDSLVPMLLAQKFLGTGQAVAIDPWATDASIAGQGGANAEWWGKVDHDQALALFRNRLARLELVCEIMRQRSDDVDPAAWGTIDLVHIDGNHGEQAVRDIERFGGRVPVGGWMVLDDLHWDGGHVTRGRERAVAMGFVDRYPLDNGCAMQRTSIRP
jgi:predicted O-methyltransferase YrrM